MKPRYTIWISHFLGLLLIVFGLWWLIGHIAGMPDYKLVLGLAAMTGLVFNHFRWRSLSKKVGDPDMFEKISLLVIANYMVLLLVLMMADYRQ